MDEAAFWRIIESHHGDAESITIELGQLADDEVSEWHRLYYDRHNALHRWDVWAAVDIIYSNKFEFPASDDSYHYFKAWVIGKGREVYETVLRDPDGLEPFIAPKDLEECCDNESLNYAAGHAWEAKGHDMDSLGERSNEFTPPAGERCEPEDWPKRFPKLVSRFGPCRF